MVDTNRTVGYKEPLYSTRLCYMFVFSVANIIAHYNKADQL